MTDIEEMKREMKTDNEEDYFYNEMIESLSGHSLLEISMSKYMPVSFMIKEFLTPNGERVFEDKCCDFACDHDLYDDNGKPTGKTFKDLFIDIFEDCGIEVPDVVRIKEKEGIEFIYYDYELPEKEGKVVNIKEFNNNEKLKEHWPVFTDMADVILEAKLCHMIEQEKKLKKKREERFNKKGKKKGDKGVR